MRGPLTLLACVVITTLVATDERAEEVVAEVGSQQVERSPREENTDAIKEKLSALNGRWGRLEYNAVGTGWQDAEFLLHGGKNRKAGANKPFPLEVKGKSFVFAGTAAGKTTAVLDPDKDPKTLDLTDAKGRTWHGIYELMEDKLTINLGLGDTRPAKIKQSGTFGQANVVYRHVREATKE